MTTISGSLTVTSVAHALIANVHSNALHIYSSTTLSLICEIALDSELISRAKTLKFSPRSAEVRVLLSTDTSIHAFDPADATWRASLANASAPTGRIAHCAFVSGDEVLVFADFGTKATLWNLCSGNGTEIASPKARGSAAYSVRPGSGHLAVLARAGGKDTVVVLAPGSRRLEVSVTLESSDAAGIKWSPDGKWLVVWESAALGPAVWVHTAEGLLFRKWTGASVDDKGIQMGVRGVEWETNGDWLVVGMGDGSIVGLRSRTFTPHFTLSHPSSISIPNSASIWQEQIAASGTTRDYAVAQQPALPPCGSSQGVLSRQSSTTAATSTAAPLPWGITHLIPSPSGSLLASVSAQTPTTVWIHALPTAERLAPLTCAVLIHHHPIRALEWNSIGTQLLISCPPSPSSAHSGADTTTSSTAIPSTDAPSSTEPHQHPPCWAYIYTHPHTSPPTATTLPIPLPSSSSSPAAEAKYTLSWAGADDDVHAPNWILASTAAGATVVAAPGSLGGGGGGSSGSGSASAVRITGEGPEDAFDEEEEEEEDEDAVREPRHGAVAVAVEVSALMGATRERVQVDDTFAFRRGWGTKVP